MTSTIDPSEFDDAALHDALDAIRYALQRFVYAPRKRKIGKGAVFIGGIWD